MGKTVGRRIAYAGNIGRFFRLFSLTAAIRSRIDRFAADMEYGLADQWMRIWSIFRQEPLSEAADFTDRSGKSRAFEEIRNRAYLDIHRNIR